MVTIFECTFVDSINRKVDSCKVTTTFECIFPDRSIGTINNYSNQTTTIFEGLLTYFSYGTAYGNGC